MSARVFLNVGIFIAGAAAGSLATYFIVRDHFAKIADEEIEDMRAWAREKVVLKDSERKKEIAEAYAEENDLDSLDTEGLNELIVKYAKQLCDLTGGDIDVVQDAVEHCEVWRGVSSVNPPDDVEQTGCEVLTANDYILDESYDNAIITYYAGDNTFVDEDGSIIDDISTFLGEHSDLVKEAKKGVYIRNHQTVCNYEVIYSEGSYT